MALQLQMNWQADLLPQKRKTGPPVGLKNLGNTCYLNSVLQCLTYTPPLANFCLKFQHSSICDSSDSGNRKRDCPFCILEKRIARSLRLDISLSSPNEILRCLRIFAENFRSGHQEDAHEFLRYVIDACHTTCLRLKKLQQQRRKNGIIGSPENGSCTTIVRDIFGGALQSQVKCMACGGESNKTDEIMDISLDVLNSSSLNEAMQNFFCPELLDGNNKYRCENCKELVVAKKQMFIIQSPNILVIQLKRFEGIFGSKVDKPILFEEELVLSSYMSKSSMDPCPAYQLFGTIVHSGYSPESGHYYAYVKDVMGRWYCCNDSYVSSSTLQEVLSEKAYVLFFSRSAHGSKAMVGEDGMQRMKSTEHEKKPIEGDDGVRPSSSSPSMEMAIECNGNVDVKKRKYKETNGNPKPMDSSTKESEITVPTTSGCEGNPCHDDGDDEHRFRRKLEELKEQLEEEASMSLAASDWPKVVHDFMLSMRCSNAKENGDSHSRLSNDELRKVMVEEAKRACISQVPDSLKGRLVNRLKAFFRENGCPLAQQ